MLLILMGFLALLVTAEARAASERPCLVPWPQKVSMTGGTVFFPRRVTVGVDGIDLKASTTVAETVVDDLRELRFEPCITSMSAGVEPEITLVMSGERSLGKEGYRLTVDGGIKVTAATETGLFWGTRTVLQLLAKGPGCVIPIMDITDKPVFEYRGVLVDVARKFHSMCFHTRMIKNLARYKMNVYHIHFSDDQSYTLPSSKFPNLPTPRRHYGKQELDEMVKLAARYHVTIVPELDMPGHSSCVCANIPDLVCRGKSPTGMVCAGSQKSYAALEALITEAMEIFPGPYFHIGADEVYFPAWDGCPDCQELIKSEGLVDNEGLYNYFINRMNRFVRSKGRRTIVWEGFKVGKEPIIDKDVLVDQFENRYAMPDALIDAGYDLINASCVPLYLFRDRGSTSQALAEWNALYFGAGHPPKALSDMIKIQPTKQLKGVCLCSWENPETAEEGLFFGTGKRVEPYAEPAIRLPIVAERAWSDTRTTAEDLMSRVNEGKRSYLAADER